MDSSAIALFGAAGRTGRAVAAALVAAGVPADRLRALVRPAVPGQPAVRLPAGARTAPPRPAPPGLPAGVRVVAADLTADADVARAVRGAGVLHVVVPNLHPDEPGIVARAVGAARAGGVPRIVYHSVLRPGLRAMPHHGHKLAAEELLWRSGLEVTVLQPSAYAQNLLACHRDGRLVVPYAVDAPFSLVDLADVAAATARVLTEPGEHAGAVYELAGPVRTVAELAAALGLGAERERGPVPPGYAGRALTAMFDWYDGHGLAGNPRVLAHLLGRPATDPSTVLAPLRREPAPAP